VRGRVVALEAGTGREVWRFNTIPTGDKLGADTWKSKLWTLAPTTGVRIGAVGNPASDLDASYRPGDELFSDSILSLNARGGKLRWHHQQRKNDPIDMTPRRRRRSSATRPCAISSPMPARMGASSARPVDARHPLYDAGDDRRQR
jgi:glucose dehydrogenase